MCGVKIVMYYDCAHVVKKAQICDETPLCWDSANSRSVLKAHDDWKQNTIQPRMSMLKGLCRLCRTFGYVKERSGEIYEEFVWGLEEG